MTRDDDDAPLPPPSKLTLIKQLWARQGRQPARRRETGRLPPGQHAVTDWPVLDLGTHPDVPHAQWQLHIYGHVAQPVVWNWSDLMQQPQTTDTSDIHCVTSWSRYDNQWEGIAIADLLETVQPSSKARYVLLHSYDGYTTNLPMEDFAMKGVMLAHAWSGAPLSAAHGGPVRLIVPHLYFWKSPKWIQKIEFRAQDAPGFWEQRGYHMRGDPWKEQRYTRDP